MRNHSFRYKLDNPSQFRKKALLWASTFSHCSYFNHNNVKRYPYGPFEEILAIGCQKQLHFDGKDDFVQLREYHNSLNDWLIGYLGYDLKNQIEKLSSDHPDHVNFPVIHFYNPEHMLFFQNDSVYVESHLSPDEVMAGIGAVDDQTNYEEAPGREQITIEANTSRSKYIETVNRLKKHIEEGDIYEINYCMEFGASQVRLDPLTIYQKLVEISPTPFSVFHKFNDSYLICASPERFLKKSGRKLISQPIKGTAKRGVSPYEDEIIKQKLRTDEKELAENMMIVDLVRNDLARSAKTGSVTVEEMFGIYTFRQLHQMISTVTSELNEKVHFVDAIKYAFPMGSMTGAPKIKVMQLIEQYESARRGLYSGAMGFITPEGDFDFNVVIRSLLYNQRLEKLSFQVGSAITYDAIAELEYEECLLKAKAILQLLRASINEKP
ncbi:Para-aminobenzoate synthase, aminase component [Fulvivirga imtechensis AK7]|uniref:Para-aminobenzoate synthase, aminase component n=1 Tax=Fulvivirga imtechensis AK7 TaxID=1237149 RepID=L8JPP3_9BACT|nr:anthranilate synthase component I family protein [Fulvivirga imtechensis]ELR69337.1 Para-aminobenzoate synthase, aminase component [Fulvivirga imtechensis AK7]